MKVFNSLFIQIISLSMATSLLTIHCEAQTSGTDGPMPELLLPESSSTPTYGALGQPTEPPTPIVQATQPVAVVTPVPVATPPPQAPVAAEISLPVVSQPLLNESSKAAHYSADRKMVYNNCGTQFDANDGIQVMQNELEGCERFREKDGHVDRWGIGDGTKKERQCKMRTPLDAENCFDANYLVKYPITNDVMFALQHMQPDSSDSKLPADAAFAWSQLVLHRPGWAAKYAADWKKGCSIMQNCFANKDFIQYFLGRQLSDYQNPKVTKDRTYLSSYIRRIVESCNGGVSNRGVETRMTDGNLCDMTKVNGHYSLNFTDNKTARAVASANPYAPTITAQASAPTPAPVVIAVIPTTPSVTVADFDEEVAVVPTTIHRTVASTAVQSSSANSSITVATSRPSVTTPSVSHTVNESSKRPNTSTIISSMNASGKTESNDE